MLGKLKNRLLAGRNLRRYHDAIAAEARRGCEAGRAAFPNQLQLPDRFAHRYPERAVELMLARLLYRPGEAILDIGHANAMPCHRSTLAQLPEPRNLSGLDIAEPVYDPRPLYRRSVRADIIEHPFREGEFDQVWCISTLEHFGADNSGYTDAFKRDTELPGQAMRSMTGLLKTGGKLLVTVPFGRFENHGWFINYDLDHWNALLAPLRGGNQIREWFFRHTHGAGWTNAEAEELAFTGYHDQANGGAAGLAALILTKGTPP